MEYKILQIWIYINLYHPLEQIIIHLEWGRRRMNSSIIIESHWISHLKEKLLTTSLPLRNEQTLSSSVTQTDKERETLGERERADLSGSVAMVIRPGHVKTVDLISPFTRRATFVLLAGTIYFILIIVVVGRMLLSIWQADYSGEWWE